MTIDFRKPARMDDVLEIVTAPLEVKGASVVLAPAASAADGEILVEATVQVAFVSGGRARPIPKALRDAMKAGPGSGRRRPDTPAADRGAGFAAPDSCSRLR